MASDKQKNLTLKGTEEKRYFLVKLNYFSIYKARIKSFIRNADLTFLKIYFVFFTNVVFTLGKRAFSTVTSIQFFN
jgi:hypothetical protein